MRVIYVDVDSLRPDHLGCYGYHRATSPNLDALARRSVTFDRYYCSDSPCLPSRAALTSGRFGIVNGVVGHFEEAGRFRLEPGHRADPDHPLLGQRLGEHGYYTASISMFAERHRAYWFYGNFRETIRATDEINDEQAHQINPRACEWLERHHDEDNWFLHINYWEPHTDYIQDPSWTATAASLGPVGSWPDEATIAAHADIYGPSSALDLRYSGFLGGLTPPPVPENMPQAIRNRQDYEHLINGYDGTILCWDHYFGELLAKLEELGIAEDTAIIVSADHGESMGESGQYSEHGLANEPTHHIPLVVYWPGVTDSLADNDRRCDALLYNLDLAPTLCDMLNVPIPNGWHGRSFAHALRGEGVESRDYLVLGHGAHSYQRAVRTRDHLYVRTYHPGAFKAEWEQLYDVTVDPCLTANLVDSQPELLDQMRARLQEWWTHYAGRPGSLPDPMQTTLGRGPTYYNDPARYMQHLRDTGRSAQAEDLAQRLGHV